MKDNNIQADTILTAVGCVDKAVLRMAVAIPETGYKELRVINKNK